MSDEPDSARTVGAHADAPHPIIAIAAARALCTISLVLCAFSALAQNAQSGWIADAQTGCKVWNERPEPKETISWSGECRDGIAQGTGTLQWFVDGKPDFRYEGNMRDGKLDGKGALAFANGGRYAGEFKDGRRNGRGIYTFANGNRYAGEFKNDKPDGKGSYAQRGSTFSGMWKNGCFRNGIQKAWVGTTAQACGF